MLESVLGSDFEGTDSSGDDSDTTDSEDGYGDKYMEQSNGIDIAVPEKYMKYVMQKKQWLWLNEEWQYSSHLYFQQR